MAWYAAAGWPAGHESLAITCTVELAGTNSSPQDDCQENHCAKKTRDQQKPYGPWIRRPKPRQEQSEQNRHYHHVEDYPNGIHV
jgi:hypothetical protein